MFSFSQSASIDLAVNWGSQSEMILSGNPILLNTCLISRSAISFAVAVFVVGMSIISFVRLWSTTDKIESFPWDSGRSVIRSIEIWAKGRRDLGPGTVSAKSIFTYLTYEEAGFF